MEILIDSANLESIRDLNDLYPIDGVTTNPTIVVKEKRTFLPLLKEIQSIIGEEKMLFAQVLGEKAEDMVKEASYLNKEINGNFYVKIPVTDEGIKAIKLLKLQGIKTLATTIYTPLQAFIAAKAGAEYVAPYVNRIDNLAGNGVQVVSDIIKIFEHHHLPCKVLAASFKNTQQVHHVCLEGAHGVTAAPEIIKSFTAHPSTETNVRQFMNEWKSFYGESSNSIIKKN
ncbi:fructose-6-phosphate aldolase (plasmid) [Priestia megaterium NCT-2]|uniref:transaldolase family protein n=1 Tax=Priestia megaterium TaxID=1404 RepID=UPI00034BFF28|nr:transaldolase family protein [Priestia megaterium]AYE53534.1 fructose-6-phosphate aldolase [Priestia megaterium NCT-2]